VRKQINLHRANKRPGKPLEPACHRERWRGLDEKAQARPDVSHREGQNHKRSDDQRTGVENFNRQAQVEKIDI
jgi:hypothetical protein